MVLHIDKLGEVWFSLATIPVIGVGWVWLDKPLVGISKREFK